VSTQLEKVERFWKWVNTERAKRNLSFRAIERIGEMANGTISTRESELKPPTYKSSEAIAKAFNLPLEKVLREAGLLPSKVNPDEELEVLLHYYDQLDRSDRVRLLEVARAFAERRVEYEAKPGEATASAGVG
jgi:transcriptional regulator with XRE-family HTH domain